MKKKREKSRVGKPNQTLSNNSKGEKVQKMVVERRLLREREAFYKDPNKEIFAEQGLTRLESLSPTLNPTYMH